MNGTIPELQDQLRVLRQRISDMEIQEFQGKMKPALNGLIGQCYVWHNNNWGEGREKKWDTFRKVIGVAFTTYNAWVLFCQCDVDADGRASLRNESQLISRDDTNPEPWMRIGGWKHCSESEYDAAFQYALNILTDPRLTTERLREKHGTPEETK